MELGNFVKGCATFIEKGIELHGDEYFNRLDEWVCNLALGSSPPRNKRVVIESLLPAFENPMFSPLFNDKKYIELKEKIKNIIKEVQ
jgi:hypothetical protein